MSANDPKRTSPSKRLSVEKRAWSPGGCHENATAGLIPMRDTVDLTVRVLEDRDIVVAMADTGLEVTYREDGKLRC